MPVSIGVFVVSYDEHPDSANSANKAHPKISSIFRLIISASFLVLSFLLAFYALKTHRKVRWHHQNSLSISPKNLAGVNFTLFFIFFSRAIYQVSERSDRALRKTSCNGFRELATDGYIHIQY